MKVLKRVLLAGFSLFFLFTFSSTSMANTAISQAGIYWTDVNKVDRKQVDF